MTSSTHQSRRQILPMRLDSKINAETDRVDLETENPFDSHCLRCYHSEIRALLRPQYSLRWRGKADETFGKSTALNFDYYPS